MSTNERRPAPSSPPRTLAWDYTNLAATYSQRPNYADAAIDALIDATGLGEGDAVVDLGAGTGHLTLKLASRKLRVTAVEPNPRMRELGVARTSRLPNVEWRNAVMESTGLPDGAFSLATYGSSFGVADYPSTLREAHRLVRPGGAMAVVFNYRDLADDLQRQVEASIRREVPGYGYGNRRLDQTAFIEASGRFDRVRRLEASLVHELQRDAWIEGFKSHATLARQAGDRFPAVLNAIDELLSARCGATIRVPYTTRVWIGWRR